MQDRVGDGSVRFALKWALTSEHFEPHHSERPEIVGFAGRASIEQVGAQVRQGAEQEARARQPGL
ncbi:MAG TPA: hypothetical protein VNN80_04315, partial [Polyangiaceae bacterium]|nr:hypothetical protein [Polyangiaceae bacterium]